jgi:hypothetical protein
MTKQLSPLEAFYQISCDLRFGHNQDKNLKIVETALKDYEKKLKALEIIKEKKPNLLVIFDYYADDIKTYKEYLDFYHENEKELFPDKHDLGKLLTEKEFDLLKEELK